MKSKVRLMQGNEACVEGAIAAGMRFYAGYPITPSTEIAELSAERLPLVGGRFMQMEDEIGGMAAIIGASLTGAKSMTATSGPGFSLKQENIGYASIAEVPCVIVNVQRGGPSTGMPTSPAQGEIMQARWGTHGDHPVIALTPSSVRETFDLTIKAFNFAEKYRTPVILLMDEVIGHMREKVQLPDPSEIVIIDRKRPDCSSEEYLPYEADNDLVPPMADFGTGYRYHVTGLVHDETGFPSNSTAVADKLIRRLSNKIEIHRDEIESWEEENTEDAEVLILSYGCVARSSKSAMNILRGRGIKVGTFRPITIWPFPEKRLRELAAKVKTIVVPEMNLGQLVLEVERICGCNAKIEKLNKVSCEIIYPEEIVSKIEEVL
ncbi:MAG TPA: 2-oxoacid:acceptor oxidoreductase subunit alpha [Bacillota bacterium]|nr:2-oxoacid:acceptor oxidoreductase subunit alpha [Bacillota bacterium]HPA55248.1 2-oxoacid:acceptor oxidoreductase subunit alpha [Bacillota bacterium]HPX70000.1 2-oxoacid:acceptor oxidoreductase subunit alpha [Bacillota bacterium]HQA66559.1 2-oxoacid:acceptor oxidoreductase subunit alpha [Bacillota bacterium]HQO42261.1 2-oxoacid:acceptor oxidoreductase subunit alpha [Bacillota bacterium]